MPITITPITYPDIPAAARGIQLAFDADPYNNWVFDKRPGKFIVERNLASLKAKCEWGIRRALFYVAKDTDVNDKVVGISMWLPPSCTAVGVRLSWSEWMDDQVLWVKQGINRVWYWGHGGLNLKRYYIWKDQQAKIQAEIWDPTTNPNAKTGFYFCNIVTVLPEYQGKGVGRKLMDVVLKKADHEGRKCYLESSRLTPNVDVYRKMGFEVVKSMRCEDDERDGKGKEGCDLFCMIRYPQPVVKGANG